MATTQISRDPFARTTELRDLVKTEATCSWCGQTRKGGKLFQYSTEKDGIRTRPNAHKGLFCSRSCHNSYHS